MSLTTQQAIEIFQLSLNHDAADTSKITGLSVYQVRNTLAGRLKDINEVPIDLVKASEQARHDRSPPSISASRTRKGLGPKPLRAKRPAGIGWVNA
jgi:hypothetical protein